MTKVIANCPFKYKGRRIVAGQILDMSPKEAKLFRAIHRVDPWTEPPPAPIPEPAAAEPPARGRGRRKAVEVSESAPAVAEPPASTEQSPADSHAVTERPDGQEDVAEAVVAEAASELVETPPEPLTAPGTYLRRDMRAED